jgi:hypothetical protein
MTAFSIRSLFAAAGLALASVSAQAAVFGPLTFSTQAEYDANFTGGLGGSRYAVDSGVLRYSATTTANSGTSITRYSPASDFRTETISANLAFADFRSTPSFGVFTRVQTSGLGVLALLNTGDSATGTANSVRIRLQYGAETAGAGIGTSFFDTNFTNLANTIATNQSLTYVLTQTADSKFNLTISDSEGVVATTGDQTLPAAGAAYTAAGGLALRSSASFTPNNIAIDNLAAVPEPTTLAALGLGAAALLRRRRA